MNDAPALKQANVGVAVSGATDAARGAADVVLLSPGLDVIVDAIIESRKIFSRMNAYALYRCCSTVDELVFLTIAILVYQFVLPPLMLVLIALFNDVSVIVIAFDNATFAKHPVDWNMKELICKTLVLGSSLVGASFIFLYLTLELWGLDSDVVATMVFLQLSLGTQINIFATRSVALRHMNDYACCLGSRMKSSLTWNICYLCVCIASSPNRFSTSAHPHTCY